MPLFSGSSRSISISKACKCDDEQASRRRHCEKLREGGGWGAQPLVSNYHRWWFVDHHRFINVDLSDIFREFLGSISAVIEGKGENSQVELPFTSKVLPCKILIYRFDPSNYRANEIP